MEKMKRRSAWMRIMAVMLALVTGITMMPLDTFAAAGKDSGAYLKGSEEAADEFMTDKAYLAESGHSHDNCGCSECYDHEDCNCDGCGDNDVCDCEECSRYDTSTGNDRITPYGSECSHTNIKYEECDCWFHYIVCQDCGEKFLKNHSGPYYGQDGTCACGLKVHNYGGYGDEYRTFAHEWGSYTSKGDLLHTKTCTKCGTSWVEEHGYENDTCVCGRVKKDDECHHYAYWSTTGPESFVNIDCATHSFICDACGEQVIDLHGLAFDTDGRHYCKCHAEVGGSGPTYHNAHKYEYVSVNDEIHQYVCSKCGYVHIKSPHYFGNGNICSDCGYERQNTTATPPTAATGLIYNADTQTGVPAGTGYTLTGNTGKNAGDYTAIATLKDGYTWTDGSTDAKEIAWSIAPATLTAVTLSATDFTYNGNVQKPTVTKVLAGELSAPFTDFTLKWSNENSKTIGSYTVTATGKNNFTGTATASYTISAESKEVDLKDAKIVGGVKKEDGTDDDDYEYTRKEIGKIGLEGPDGKPLVKGKEYEWTVIEKEDDGPKWEIVSKPVKGKSKGDDLITIKKRSTKKHNVTVNYVLPVTGQPVAPSVIKSYEEGAGFSIESPTVAVPGKPGKFYTPSRKYVNGHMGTEDLEYSVEYIYQETSVLKQLSVEVNYVIERRKDDTTTVPPENVSQVKFPGEKYRISSPEIKNYRADKWVVEGTMGNQNVAVTVTYYPLYTATCTYKFPGGGGVPELEGGYTVEYTYADGKPYHFPVNAQEALKFVKADADPRYKEANEKAFEFQSIKIWDSGWREITYKNLFEHDLNGAWGPTPAQDIDGVIQGADVEFTVTYACTHPDCTYLQDEESSDADHNGSHYQRCNLCWAELEETWENCTFKNSRYIPADELSEAQMERFPDGAMVYECTHQCGNTYMVNSKDDVCPASSKDDPQPHIWGKWNKISETQCERTCARCKLTITSGHVWGEWKPGYSNATHSRMCDLCHTSQTANHGGWKNVNVKTPATCIANAVVSAECGICGQHMSEVYFGLVGSIKKEYEKTGHQFDGGYVNIHNGHTQKCSLCGAFDMEHHEEHSWGEPVETKTGVCGSGKIKLTYSCRCGATKSEEIDWTHNFVRDTAREVGATCDTAGTECYTCTSCQEHNDKQVDKLGHNWVEDEGNYPAACDKEGRMWFHCSNPGCDMTKKEDCPALSPTGHHVYERQEQITATCTLPGYKDTWDECKYCHDKINNQSEPVSKLGHKLVEDRDRINWRTRTVTGPPPHIIDEEVFFVTRDCSRCGYHAPSQMYTVARSENLSRYKIETGDVKVSRLDDGVKVTGQFGKDNVTYFNKTVDGAFQERLNTDKELFSQKAGSVETHFKQEYLNTLEDGRYDFIQTNGDELAVATVTVTDHKITDVEDGVLPIDDTQEENVMPDGEFLFYLGEAEDVMTDIKGTGESFDVAGNGNPTTTPYTADFDVDGNGKSHKDIEFYKNDKGHEFVKLTIDGEDMPKYVDEASTIPACTIENDKITLTREYLETLGEGTHVIALVYSDGAQGYFMLIVIGSGGTGPQPEEDPDTWNLFTDGSEHVYTVSGITSKNEVANSNTSSAKYFTAVLSKDKITVNLKEDADRKKAADANTFDFDLGDEGAVSYTLPFTYNKPVLKLSSIKGTVKKGTETTLKTTVLCQNEDGNFVPYDLSEAVVSYGRQALDGGADGVVAIVASSKATDVIKVSKEGWNEKDPIALKYTISEAAADKDVLEADFNGVKQVILNTNNPEQSFTFPLTLNGEGASAETVEIVKGKKGEENLAQIGNGIVTVSLGRSGIGKGTYTITLKPVKESKARAAIKVKVTDKAMTASGKIALKMDVVTKKPMIVIPKIKQGSGQITGAEVTGITLKKGTPKPASAFKAEVKGSYIEVSYAGSEEMTASDLKIGDMTLTLTVEDSEGAEAKVPLTLKSVTAKKTTPAVRSGKVVIPKALAEKADGTYVIASANILSTYKDSAKHVRTIAPVSAELTNKNVEAEVDPDNPNRILIKKLSGKKGSVKVKLTYPGGVTKTVTISVKRSK